MKETFYFSHDYNSRHDPKLAKLRVKETQAGKGIYWDIIEMLYEQGGYLHLDDIEVYAELTFCTVEQFSRIISDYKLFQKDENKFWSESVLRRLKERQDKSVIAKENGKKGGIAKAKSYQNPTKILPNDYQNSTENLPIKERKEKESKEKESKEKEINIKGKKEIEESFPSFNFFNNNFFKCKDKEVFLQENEIVELINEFPKIDVYEKLQRLMKYLESENVKRPYSKNLISRIKYNFKLDSDRAVTDDGYPELTPEQLQEEIRIQKAIEKRDAEKKANMEKMLEEMRKEQNKNEES